MHIQESVGQWLGDADQGDAWRGAPRQLCSPCPCQALVLNVVGRKARGNSSQGTTSLCIICTFTGTSQGLLISDVLSQTEVF